MGWKTFNDRIALVLFITIPALWALTGRGIITLNGEVMGALIATWTLVITYYFRKQPPSGGSNA